MTWADPSWLSFVADLMLAAAALYVTVQALRVWFMEVAAAKPAEGKERQAKLNDAKTFYALASLSKVWVLLLVLGGTLIKLGLSTSTAPWW